MSQDAGAGKGVEGGVPDDAPLSDGSFLTVGVEPSAFRCEKVKDQVSGEAALPHYYSEKSNYPGPVAPAVPSEGLRHLNALI